MKVFCSRAPTPVLSSTFILTEVPTAAGVEPTLSLLLDVRDRPHSLGERPFHADKQNYADGEAAPNKWPCGHRGPMEAA